MRTAFEPAARRLALGGTPFRGGTRSMPFVRYQIEQAEPDFEYGYGALRDRGVVRPASTGPVLMQARDIADLKRSRLGVMPTVATSDDPTADRLKGSCPCHDVSLSFMS